MPTINRVNLTLRCFIFLFACITISGCGGGSAGADSDFTFTGTSAVSGPQSVTFNFVRAMSPLEVPSDTTQIRFYFFDGEAGTGTLVQRETRDFAPTITISPVSSKARSVVITALSPEGYPRLDTVVALSSGEQEVDFAGTSSRVITPERLTVAPPTATIEVGRTQSYQAAVLFSNGETVVPEVTAITWQATNQATIDGNGLATGTADGVSTITATFESIEGTAELTVGAGLQLTRLEVTPDNASVALGGDIPFSVVGFDQNDGPFSLEGLQVVWSATGDASVDADTGVATGTGLVPDTLEGNATITATVGTVSDSTGLTIIGLPGALLGIDTTPDPLMLDLDSPNGSLTTTGDFENGPDTVLSNAQHGLHYGVTGNPGVASVNMLTGEVTAIAQGTTQIRSTVGSQTDVVAVEVDFGTTGNMAPVITLGSSLAADFSSPVNAFPNATVTDPTQAAFVGGTLTVTDLSGVGTITLPTMPDIGIITSNGSDSVSVALTAQATPANVQTVLRNSTISGVTGTSLVTVTIADGQGMNGMAQKVFSPGDLVLSDGMTHTFDTDTGVLDSESAPRVGWDGTTLSLTSFELGAGTTLKMSGSQAFSLNTSGNIIVDGTLDGRGSDGANGSGVGNGGDGSSGFTLNLTAGGDLQFTGTIDVQGGNGGNGGNAGSAVGTVKAGDGGNGGDAGMLSLAAGNTLTNSGTVMRVGGDGGDGGSIVVPDLNPSVQTAGNGGNGGSGTVGGNGGKGGDISVGDTVLAPNVATSGTGGDGGAGTTAGGDGGQAGDILIGDAVNTPNTVIAGDGGNGGAGDTPGNGARGGNITAFRINGSVNTVHGGNGGAGGAGGPSGGDGGDGGYVTVTGDNGGDSVQGGDGGNGGLATANGGNGGAGGNGGSVTVGLGNSGAGGAGGTGGNGGPGGSNGANGASGTP